MASETKRPARRMFRPKASWEPTAAELAEWIGGASIDAPEAGKRHTGMATLEQADGTEISFVTGAKYAAAARESAAGLFIAPKGIELPGRPRVETANVWKAVARVLTRLYPPPVARPGVHPSAALGEGVKLGEGVSIGPACFLGNGVTIGARTVLGAGCSIDAACSVGADSHFHANVSLQGLVHVGNRVILHSGVVLGADGFRFEMGDAGILKIPQIGAVIIEDEVEIGANTTVDRPFLHETRIGWGTKIDNQVQIAHNCMIGRLCIIAGCVGMSGSVTLGDACMVGGGSVFREGVVVGAGCKIGGMSGIHADLPPGSMVMGVLAVPVRDFYSIQAHLPRLPELAKRVRRLEQAAASGKAGEAANEPPPADRK